MKYSARKSRWNAILLLVLAACVATQVSDPVQPNSLTDVFRPVATSLELLSLKNLAIPGDVQINAATQLIRNVTLMLVDNIYGQVLPQIDEKFSGLLGSITSIISQIGNLSCPTVNMSTLVTETSLNSRLQVLNSTLLSAVGTQITSSRQLFENYVDSKVSILNSDTESKLRNLSSSLILEFQKNITELKKLISVAPTYSSEEIIQMSKQYTLDQLNQVRTDLENTINTKINSNEILLTGKINDISLTLNAEISSQISNLRNDFLQIISDELNKATCPKLQTEILTLRGEINSSKLEAIRVSKSYVDGLFSNVSNDTNISNPIVLKLRSEISTAKEESIQISNEFTNKSIASVNEKFAENVNKILNEKDIRNYASISTWASDNFVSIFRGQSFQDDIDQLKKYIFGQVNGTDCSTQECINLMKIISLLEGDIEALKKLTTDNNITTEQKINYLDIEVSKKLSIDNFNENMLRFNRLNDDKFNKIDIRQNEFDQKIEYFSGNLSELENSVNTQFYDSYINQSALNTTMSEAVEKLDTVSKKVSVVEQNIPLLSNDIQELKNQMNEKENKIDSATKFEEANKKMDNLQTEIFKKADAETVNSMNETVNKKIGGLESKISDIQVTVAEIQGNINKLSTGVNDLTFKTDSIIASMSVVDSRVTSIADRTSQLEGGSSGLSVKISEIDQKIKLTEPILENLTEKVPKMEKDTADLTGQFTELSGAVKTIDDKNTKLSEIVTKHDEKIIAQENITTQLNGQVANLDQSVSDLNSRALTHSNNISDFAGNLSEISNNTTKLAADISQISDDVNNIKPTLIDLSSTVEILYTNSSAYFSNISVLFINFENTKISVDENSKKIVAVENTVSDHSLKIFTITETSLPNLQNDINGLTKTLGTCSCDTMIGNWTDLSKKLETKTDQTFTNSILTQLDTKTDLTLTNSLKKSTDDTIQNLADRTVLLEKEIDVLTPNCTIGALNCSAINLLQLRSDLELQIRGNITSVSNEISNIDQRLSDTSKKTNEFGEGLTTLKTNVSENSGNITDLKTGFGNLQQLTENTKNDLASLGTTVNENNRNITEIKSNLEAVKIQSDSTQKDFLSLNTIVIEIGGNMTESKTNFTSLQNFVTTLSQTTENLTSNFSEISDTLSNATADIILIKGDVENNKKGVELLNDITNGLATNLLNLTTWVDSADSATNKLSGNLTNLTKFLDTSFGENGSMAVELSNLSKSVEDIKNKTAAFQDDVIKMQANVENLNTATKDLNTRFENLTNVVNQANKSTKDLQTQVDKVQGNVELLDSRTLSLTSEVNSTNKLVGEIDTRTKDLPTKIDNLGSDVKRFNETTAALNSNLSSLAGAVVEISNSTANLTTGLTKITDMVDELNNKTDSQDIRLFKISEDAKITDNKLTQLNTDQANLTNVVEKISKSTNDLTLDLSAISGEVNSFGKRIDTLESNITNVTEQFQRVDKITNNLSAEIGRINESIKTTTPGFSGLRSDVDSLLTFQKNVTSEIARVSTDLKSNIELTKSMENRVANSSIYLDIVTAQFTTFRSDTLYSVGSYQSQITKLETSLQDLTTSLDPPTGSYFIRLATYFSPAGACAQCSDSFVNSVNKFIDTTYPSDKSANSKFIDDINKQIISVGDTLSNFLSTTYPADNSGNRNNILKLNETILNVNQSLVDSIAETSGNLSEFISKNRSELLDHINSTISKNLTNSEFSVAQKLEFLSNNISEIESMLITKTSFIFDEIQLLNGRVDLVESSLGNKLENVDFLENNKKIAANLIEIDKRIVQNSQDLFNSNQVMNSKIDGINVTLMTKIDQNYQNSQIFTQSEITNLNQNLTAQLDNHGIILKNLKNDLWVDPNVSIDSPMSILESNITLWLAKSYDLSMNVAPSDNLFGNRRLLFKTLSTPIRNLQSNVTDLSDQIVETIGNPGNISKSLVQTTVNNYLNGTTENVTKIMSDMIDKSSGNIFRPVPSTVYFFDFVSSNWTYNNGYYTLRTKIDDYQGYNYTSALTMPMKSDKVTATLTPVSSIVGTDLTIEVLVSPKDTQLNDGDFNVTVAIY
jgi:chromosome segregation ATPase